jgi:hypothetical protein
MASPTEQQEPTLLRTVPGRLASILDSLAGRGIDMSKAILGRLLYIWGMIDPVAPEWAIQPGESPFEPFYRMVRDTGLPPPNKTRLTLKDPNKSYGPGNTRWSVAFRPGSVSHDPRYRRAYTTWRSLWEREVYPFLHGNNVVPGSPATWAACAQAHFPWPLFENFTDQVPLPPAVAARTRLRLERIDPRKPWSKDNVRWTTTPRIEREEIPRRQKAYQAWRRLGADRTADWDTFDAFLRDVGLPPAGFSRCGLGKSNLSLPHGPKNTSWVGYGEWVRSGSSPAAGASSAKAPGLDPSLALGVTPAAPPPAPSGPAMFPAPAGRPCPCGRRQVFDPDLDRCMLCVIEIARISTTVPVPPEFSAPEAARGSAPAAL